MYCFLPKAMDDGSSWLDIRASQLGACFIGSYNSLPKCDFARVLFEVFGFEIRCCCDLAILFDNKFEVQCIFPLNFLSGAVGNRDASSDSPQKGKILVAGHFCTEATASI